MTVWALVSYADKHWDVMMKMYEDAIPPELTILLMDCMELQIETGENLKAIYNGEEIPLPDAFWPTLSNTDYLLIEHLLLEAGVPCVLNLSEVAVAKSKILTYHRLAKNNIRVPKTVVFFHRSKKETILSQVNFPFVVKPDGGFGGEGVQLIHNEAELDDCLAALSYGVAYVAQEYISTSHGKDVRVTLLNGELMSSSMRSSQDPNEFRSNLHVGGKLLDYEIDEPTLQLCKKIAGLFQLPLIGLDLMFGKDEFVLAEVNAFPGLYPQYMSKASDAILQNFLAKK